MTLTENWNFEDSLIIETFFASWVSAQQQKTIINIFMKIIETVLIQRER
jgi:hypothetical protein